MAGASKTIEDYNVPHIKKWTGMLCILITRKDRRQPSVLGPPRLLFWQDRTFQSPCNRC